MPQLRWDKLDFVECLETPPVVEEYETVYEYTVARGGLTLVVKIWPLESVIQLALSQGTNGIPVTQFALFVRGVVQQKNYRGHPYLEVQDCILMPSRFSYMDVDGSPFEHKDFPQGLTIHISIKPSIQIKFVRPSG